MMMMMTTTIIMMIMLKGTVTAASKYTLIRIVAMMTTVTMVPSMPTAWMTAW